jgi:hypothetical protein
LSRCYSWAGTYLFLTWNMGRLVTWKDGSDFDTILNVSLATIVVKFLSVILDS